jgi:glycosyltransferase involved in cell wall biosynthesis
MKIGVFPTIVGRQGGGVETYEISLVRALAEMSLDELHIYCLSQRAADAFDLKQAARAAAEAQRNKVQFEVLRPASRWISIPFSLPPAIKRSGVDLVHATFIPPLRCSVPLLMSVHDICVHTHPELYPATIRWRLNTLLYNRLHRMDHILCPTQTTKNLMIEHFRVPEERVSVSPYAVDAQFQQVPEYQLQEVLGKYGLARPYLLFAGNLRVGNKNLIRLLEAYHKFRAACGNDAKLVLTGRRSWRSKELDAAMDQLDLRRSIIETGWLPPEHVPALYSGATMLLFPTLCEGFGLPALESMACGTPVLTSNVSCLPEVTGGAALLVDPLKVDEIADGIVQLYRDTRLQEDLRQKGLAWVKQFTWQRTAKETREAYCHLLAKQK